jgi:hypothetical protein
MAIYDGRKASVRVGDDTAGSKVAALQNITFPAGITQIDLTTVDDSAYGYQRSRPGLKTGSFQFTCLYDPVANADLIALCLDATTTVNVYARFDDADATPFLAWEARLSADFATGGVQAASTMTVTVYREGEATA